MNLKKIIASVSVCAAAVVSLAAMTFQTTAQTDITYTGPTSGAVGVDNSGTDYRLSIYNSDVNVTDINNLVNAEKNIVVTFTVSGLGSHKNNVDSSGNASTAYEARLLGQVGTNQYWNQTGDTVINTPVSITGDGQYKAVFNLNSAASSIDSLILQTNININQLDVENPASAEVCGLTIKIDSIVADSDDTSATPTYNLVTDTTTAPTLTDSTTTYTTANSTVLGNSTQVDSASTGDSGVAVAAVAGLVITAAIGVATQIKRKK